MWPPHLRGVRPGTAVAIADLLVRTPHKFTQAVTGRAQFTTARKHERPALGRPTARTEQSEALLKPRLPRYGRQELQVEVAKQHKGHYWCRADHL